MSDRGVILYGPPGSGKDTITDALTKLDPTFVHYPRIKVGAGRAAGYRMLPADELGGLRRRGSVLYENVRYGNRYVVDNPGLAGMFHSGVIPVIHVGQVVAVRAIRSYPAEWFPVLLWCARESTRQRAWARQSVDVEARLEVWDETASDIETNGTRDFAMRIDTDRCQPDKAARLIRSRLLDG